jgi:tetratricopeptide (TPR) repeat protein
MESIIQQRFKLAAEAHLVGRHEEAQYLYGEILKIEPNHLEANHGLGVIQVSLNQSSSALPLLKIALKGDPGQRQYWISYIDALLKENLIMDAKNILEQGKKRGISGPEIEIFESLIAGTNQYICINQLSHQSRLNPAIDMRELGRYKESQEWLEKHIENKPGDVEACCLLSHVYMLDKKEVQAEKVLLETQLLNHEHPAVHRNQARLLLKKSQYKEALTKARSAVEKTINDPEDWLVLSNCLSANKCNDEALKLIEKVLQVKPKYAEAYASRAIISLSRGNVIDSILDAEKATKFKPHLTQIWVLLSSLYYQNKNTSEAINSLRKACSLEPENADYLVQLGEYLRRNGNISEAVEILELVTKKFNNNVNGWINLGAAYQQGARIYDAKKVYENALKINPKSAEISNNLGAISTESEDFESAVKYFKQAISIKPEYAEAYHNYGVLLKRVGQNEIVKR